MNVEVCIFPRGWVIASDQSRTAPKLRDERRMVTCFDDLDEWMRSQALGIRLDGHLGYRVYIGVPGEGYSCYEFPTVRHTRDYTGIRDALWHLVDLHVAFDMGAPRELIRHAS